MNMENPEIIKNEIGKFARELGFDLIGVSPAVLENKYTRAFNDWLGKKYQAEMKYMEKKELRNDLGKILPRARAVICLATNYYHAPDKLKPRHGRVARYAYGRDYHKIIGKKLKTLEAHIHKLAPAAEIRSYVDTGPVLERAFAEQAGIGFIGKNSCLITPEYGSWVFLAEIITTLPLPPDRKTLNTEKPFAGCGGCRKCIDACPTGAIVAPGVIDSSKCISYLTIENRQDIPPKLAKIIKKARLLYGCDICQEVCPHNNSRQRISTHPELKIPRLAGDQLPLQKILSLTTDAQFLTHFAGSPLMRAKRTGLQRNALTLAST